jgi:proteasome lid subunit RPN8/RPN11
MPRPLLEFDCDFYRQLIRDLARSGRGVKESGAFLLGTVEPIRRITDYLLYEEIAPQTALMHDYVALTGTDMAAAWDACRAKGLQVVADIHTHPGAPVQSVSDRAHPIVSIAGHVAVIVPDFAVHGTETKDLGVHLFLGNGRWESYFSDVAQDCVYLTEGSRA